MKLQFDIMLWQSFFFALQTVYDDSMVDLLHQALLDIPDLQLAYLKYHRRFFWASTGQCICWGVPDDATSDPRKSCYVLNRPFGACYFHIHDKGETCFRGLQSGTQCPKHSYHPATGSITA